MVFTNIENRGKARVYVSVCACVHEGVYCVCIGEGVEQVGIKDVVPESLTSKAMLWLKKANLTQLERKVRVQ